MPPATEGIPPGKPTVTLDDWKERLIKAGTLNPKGNPRQQFQRIRVRLSNTGNIGIWDDHVWVVT